LGGKRLRRNVLKEKTPGTKLLKGKRLRKNVLKEKKPRTKLLRGKWLRTKSLREKKLRRNVLVREGMLGNRLGMLRRNLLIYHYLRVLKVRWGTRNSFRFLEI
jgi:hypothetical protein